MKLLSTKWDLYTHAGHQLSNGQLLWVGTFELWRAEPLSTSHCETGSSEVYLLWVGHVTHSTPR